MAEARGELAAHITWPNLEVSHLTDLSYKGFAARRPGLFPFAAQQVVDVHLALGIMPSFSVRARIVWFNLDLVGAELNELPPEGHLAMADYLDAKLLGSSLRPVQSSVFDKSSTFDFWMQGPSGISVFVWMKTPLVVEQVHLDLGDEEMVFFAREKKLQLLSPRERKALLILSQMDKPGLPMEEFVRSIAPGA
jgi:hypothetical protein